ncbi:MAG: glutamine amidotransferase-related protein, partial [Parvibaculales bacterium]
MAVKHKSRPVYGVQFHPESIATAHGHKLLGNFLQTAGMNVAADIAPQHLSLEV